MNDNTEKKSKGKRGGARPGSGRPKGSGNAITIAGLLSQVTSQTRGKDYEAFGAMTKYY